MMMIESYKEQERQMKNTWRQTQLGINKIKGFKPKAPMGAKRIGCHSLLLVWTDLIVVIH